MARKSSLHFVSAGFLLVVILLGVFVWQPLREETTALTQTLFASQANLAQIQKQVSDLVSIEANLPVAEIERNRVLGAVPLGLRQDELIEDLDGIASKVGIDLNSITFSVQSDDTDPSSTVSIVANFMGNYSNLITLLQAFETNSRLFRATAIGVQLGDVTESGQQMTFSVSLEAYFQDVPTELESASVEKSSPVVE
ncbi:MAG: hypothetical protein ACD_28C00224G0002 [uncultured bacterium]|nr:MAG: hypothetical protein ACD_28C00224G0002 [uncultured bacterium]KKT75704.1 MAG: hypothetical protein UW70_C0030G0023 [Candidatus Peregrinibacteria bacterium GW2011_GWA2_44_7]